MRIALLVVALASVSAWLHGQTPPQSGDTIAFDVASIRPVEGGRLFAIGPPVNGTFRARATTVRWLTHYAYGREPLDRNPLPEGGPSWIDHELYEVVGQGPPDLTFPDARRAVLTLLRERFMLKDHVEKRELSVYHLVVASKDGGLGPGLRTSKADCRSFSETLLRTGRRVIAQELTRDCELRGGRDDRNRLRRLGTITIRELIREMIQGAVDRLVIDRTGLTGTYDVDVMWAPEPGPGAAGAALAVAPSDFVSIFTALHEQLGLRLEPRREPIDVIVIDSVERPTPN